MTVVEAPLAGQLADLVRVLFAGLLGAIVGYERHLGRKQAGIRDHILVCAGSCLFTLAGFAFGTESSRLAAGVVTGVGFLGAGAILQRHGNVRGLTTAAGIWAVAAVGVAVGVGFSLLAAASTLSIFLTLRYLRTNEPGERGTDTD